MKNKYQRILYISLICISICFLSSCIENEHISQHIPWIEKWLATPKCDPPCWENIIPGITTAQEGYEILTNLQEIFEIRGPNKTIKGQSIGWSMKGCEGKTGGVFLFEEYPNGTINSLTLFIGCSEDNTSLSEIINSFGNPDYVWAEKKELECTQDFLYVEKGMMISTYKMPSFLRKPNDQELLVASVLFFEPQKDIQTTLDKLGYSDGPEIKVWQSIDEDPCSNK